jgi:hypothetical protein
VVATGSSTPPNPAVVEINNATKAGSSFVIRGDETPASTGCQLHSFSPQPPDLTIVIADIICHRELPVARREASKSLILLRSEDGVNRAPGDEVFHFA